ncbi:hypothetical protein [Glycomyces niveus]|uniref:Lipoprotein n=1 Tax=Glycomyces niveus TaxID=2820287 RepID=A0ABS3UAS2_9ACTN|nr:hypothetical protein [Glycomyces sp. NEAU-S30]MBO3735833.1 hypothetical protein [Glycomyces sp. NEAU-S30]
MPRKIRRGSPTQFSTLRFLSILVAAALTGACMSPEHEKQDPPERSFDQSTAWQVLEDAAAEAIADLPDFPGFEVRTMQLTYCEQYGETGKEYVAYELTYEFSDDVSADPLVRETYRELLREKWNSSGYDVHRDEQRGDDPPFYSLEARRPDQVNYWYWVAGLTVLRVQSGCIKAAEGGEYNPDCPTPLGGVTRENDRASKYCSNIDTVYPGEETTSEAVDPFSTPSEESSAPAGMVPWSREPKEAESSPATYEGLL